MTELHAGGVYLDTNVFIDAFEGDQSAASRCGLLLHVRRTILERCTSELTLAEVLGRASTAQATIAALIIYYNALSLADCSTLQPFADGTCSTTRRVSALAVPS